MVVIIVFKFLRVCIIKYGVKLETALRRVGLVHTHTYTQAHERGVGGNNRRVVCELRLNE